MESAIYAVILLAGKLNDGSAFQLDLFTTLSIWNLASFHARV